MKIAELTNTNTMPAEQSDLSPEKTKAVVLKKAATVGHLVQGKERHHGKDVEPDVAHPPTKEMPERFVQAKTMSPHVDVSGFEPPRVIQEKKASLFALKDKYPLDNYAHVKRASAYFDEMWTRFAPEDRHTFAVNMVKRAEELGIETSEVAKRYGSETYAPVIEVKIALDARKQIVSEEKHKVVLDKLASLMPQLPPELFCETLAEFDKTAGIDMAYDRDIPDPYYSTFGMTKKAEFSETIGNTTVHQEDLEYLALKHLPLIRGIFTEDVAGEFLKDPIGIYKSMPLEQRKVMANMACEQRAGAPSR